MHPAGQFTASETQESHATGSRNTGVVNFNPCGHNIDTNIFPDTLNDALETE
jgi:hypothetical protein